MSQVTAYTIPGSPLTMSQLATRLEDLFGASVSQNRGATAPNNPVLGMFWWDTAGDPVETLKMYRATGWVTVLSVDVDTGDVLWLGDMDAGSLTTGTLAAARLPESVNDASNLTTGTLAGERLPSTVGAVGTYAFLRVINTGGAVIGAGSDVAFNADQARYASVEAGGVVVTFNAPEVTGTWRIMGHQSADSTAVSLWFRVS